MAARVGSKGPKISEAKTRTRTLFTLPKVMTDHEPDVVQFDGQKAKEQEEHHQEERIRLEMVGKAGKHNPRNHGRKDDQEQNNIVQAEHIWNLGCNR